MNLETVYSELKAHCCCKLWTDQLRIYQVVTHTIKLPTAVKVQRLHTFYFVHYSCGCRHTVKYCHRCRGCSRSSLLQIYAGKSKHTDCKQKKRQLVLEAGEACRAAELHASHSALQSCGASAATATRRPAAAAAAAPTSPHARHTRPVAAPGARPGFVLPLRWRVAILL